MYLSHKIDDNDNYPMLYAAVATPAISILYLDDYTMYIPKLLEICLTSVMIIDNTISLTYFEYIFIYVNILLNYIQLFKPLDMLIC